MLLTIPEFIGRLHPLLVHLPIGILLIGLLLQWLSTKEKYRISNQALLVVIFTGMCAAFLSCITGYILSISEEYDEQLIGWHFWMGICVAVSSMFLCMKVARQEFDWIYKTLSVAVLVFLVLAGHLGASITHGRDYLFGSEESMDTSTVPPKPIADIMEAGAYTDVIQPILQKQCYGCHGPKRQKGKFRLDDPLWMMKGGKDGVTVVPFKAGESELVKRVKLPLEDDNHMPPKDKKQLKENQVLLIQWWINNGADFTKKVKDLDQPGNIHSLLVALQNTTPAAEKKENLFIPTEPVEKAAEKDLEALRKTGALVMAVARNSNYLEVNFLNAAGITDKELLLLKPVQKQLVSLKLGNTKITDSALKLISGCSQLSFLQLNNTAISDKGLVMLTGLHNLRSLNLTETGVSAEGIMQLRKMKVLGSLYLFHTRVNKGEWKKLEQAFPGTRLDSGGYQVPYLYTDTTLVKEKKK